MLRQRVPGLGFLVELVQVFLDRRVTRSAAELAYDLTLTLFPTLIVIIDVVGRLPLNSANVVETISQVLPENTAALIGGYLRYVQLHQSTTMLTAAVITIVIAASGAFRALASISGEIYGAVPFQGLWGLLFSFVFSLLLVALIYLSFVVLLTGNWFFRILREHLPFIYMPAYWPQVRLALLFGVAMLFLALLYWLTGPKGKGRPQVAVGAFLAAALLTLGTTWFSALMGLSSRYSMVYGSLASVILLMMWLFVCGNIVILGQVFNYVYFCRLQHRSVVVGALPQTPQGALPLDPAGALPRTPLGPRAPDPDSPGGQSGEDSK
jgi:membrane protein